MSPPPLLLSFCFVVVALSLPGNVGCGRTPLAVPDPDAAAPRDAGPDDDPDPTCTGYVPASCDGPGDGPAPGQRPSASRDACDWLPESPPGLGGDLACCELGTVRSLADEADGGGPVSAVPIPGGAVVGWSLEDTRFRRLDASGAPIDPGPVAYSGRLGTFASGACGVASAAQDRLVVSTDAVVRETLVPLGSFPDFAPTAGPRLAYTPLGEGYLVATQGVAGGTGFLLEHVDADRRVARQELVGTPSGRTPGVASVGSLTVVAWIDATAEVGYATLEAGEALGTLSRVPGLEPVVGFGGVGLGAFRDDVVLATATGREVRVAFVSPFTGDVRVPPRAVGETEVFQRVHVAGADELALVGLCYAAGPSPTPPRPRGEDRLAFRLLTMDGDPVGPELTIAEGLSAPPRCAIAWAEGRFFVAWWRVDGPTGGGVLVRTVTVLR